MNEDMEKFLKNKSHTLSFRRTTEELNNLLGGEVQRIELHGITFEIKRLDARKGK